MTHTQLSALLADLAPLGLTQRGLAALFGYASKTSIRRMLAGEQPIPDHLAAWVRGLHRWWEGHRPS